MLVAVVLLATSAVHADDRPKGALACTRGTRTVLSELACEIAAHIGTSTMRSAIVATGPISSDNPPEQPHELATRLSSVVAGRLGQSIEAAEGALALGSAQAAAEAAGHLIYLRPRLAHGRFQVTFDVYSVPRSFWDRVRNTVPSPIEHGYAERRLDAELASFWPTIPLVISRIDKASADAPALSMACGDIEGNGSLSLLWVDRHRIAIARVRSRALAVARVVRWNALSEVAAAPLRQPIAMAFIALQGLWVGLTDRRDGLLLSPQLEVIERLPARLPWPPAGCLSALSVGLGELGACLVNETGHADQSVQSPVDAAASAVVVDRQGTGRTLLAWRDAASGVAHVRDDRGRSVRIESAGAQLALGDIDRDGQPEILHSADTLDPAGDALVVLTWQDDGILVERFRIAVPTGVHALAVCPAEGDGLSPVAVGSGDGVWIVR